MKTIFLALIILTVSPAFAAEFSVDDSSYLHFGVSAVIAATTHSVLASEEVRPLYRAITTGVTCMSFGAFKEFAMDAYPDYGDLAFDALGCAVGIGIVEGITLQIRKNGLGLQGTW